MFFMNPSDEAKKLPRADFTDQANSAAILSLGFYQRFQRNNGTTLFINIRYFILRKNSGYSMTISGKIQV